jgi:hypothetical protein
MNNILAVDYTVRLRMGRVVGSKDLLLFVAAFCHFISSLHAKKNLQYEPLRRLNRNKLIQKLK